MKLIFADDSKNRSACIPDMGPLVSIGGFIIDSDSSGPLIREIDDICARYDFPPHDEFKWSPGRELWMRENLIDAQRESFYLEILEKLTAHEVKAIICINDTNYNTATGGDDHEFDVTKLFVERIEKYLIKNNSHGLIIVDRPGGNRHDEDNFLLECLNTLEQGTDYVKPEKFAHNVVSTPSKFSRLLQCADVITGCVTAHVGGEATFSTPIFNKVKEILLRGYSRTSGYGLKIHPEHIYENLYHWLLGEDLRFYGMNIIGEYPVETKKYCRNPYVQDDQ